jgi:hypothetical protein
MGSGGRTLVGRIESRPACERPNESRNRLYILKSSYVKSNSVLVSSIASHTGEAVKITIPTVGPDGATGPTRATSNAWQAPAKMTSLATQAVYFG